MVYRLIKKIGWRIVTLTSQSLSDGGSWSTWIPSVWRVLVSPLVALMLHRASLWPIPSVCQSNLMTQWKRSHSGLQALTSLYQGPGPHPHHPHPCLPPFVSPGDAGASFPHWMQVFPPQAMALTSWFDCEMSASPLITKMLVKSPGNPTEYLLICSAPWDLRSSTVLQFSRLRMHFLMSGTSSQGMEGRLCPHLPSQGSPKFSSFFLPVTWETAWKQNPT